MIFLFFWYDNVTDNMAVFFWFLGLDLVLKGIDFEIMSGEKIGNYYQKLSKWEKIIFD